MVYVRFRGFSCVILCFLIEGFGASTLALAETQARLQAQRATKGCRAWGLKVGVIVKYGVWGLGSNVQPVYLTSCLIRC